MFYAFFFLMIRRPPRSTLDRSSAASDVYKRQIMEWNDTLAVDGGVMDDTHKEFVELLNKLGEVEGLSLIHISEPTRPY